ncbi:CDP-glycerol glycerophosphotransferase family protein [Vibrio breoganii]
MSLENKSKYSIVRAISFIRGMVPSLINLLIFKKNTNVIIVSSQFNETFEHNSKYFFLYLLDNQHRHDYKIYYVVNDDNKRSELVSSYGDYFITNTRIEDIVKIICAKNWVISSFETPILGFFLSFKRNVIHLSHGSPLKSIGLNVKNLGIVRKIYYGIVKHNITYFCSSGAVFDNAWITCLSSSPKYIIKTPMIRNDERLIHRHRKDFILRSNKNDKAILYAPTWRPSTEVDLFPFDDFSATELSKFLDLNNIILYIRLHPNFFISEIEKISKIKKIKRVVFLTNDKLEDINEVLFDFDILITDYSSIYVDYLLTLKPIIFLPYDLDNYNKEVGFSIDYYKFTPGPKPKSFSVFLENIIRSISDKGYFMKERQKANRLLNIKSDNRADDFFMEIRKYLD